MNNPKNPKLGHNKKTFLEKPVEHIDITTFDSRKIIESMDKMSFTSRDTAKASNIFNEMLSDKNCTIFLTLAGSTSAAGCMKIYSDRVKWEHIHRVFELCNRNVSETARRLKMHRRTLQRILSKKSPK